MNKNDNYFPPFLKRTLHHIENKWTEALCSIGLQIMHSISAIWENLA